jgi:hypothetical protein
MSIVDSFMLEFHEYGKRNYGKNPHTILLNHDKYYILMADKEYNKYNHFDNKTIFGIPYVITEQVQGFELK